MRHTRNPLVVGKVWAVKCEDVRDGVDVHHANNPGVVNLDARDGVVHDQASPLKVNRRRFIRDSEDAFDQPDASLGLLNR
jgi:hypothetical protein